MLGMKDRQPATDYSLRASLAIPGRMNNALLLFFFPSGLFNLVPGIALVWYPPLGEGGRRRPSIGQAGLAGWMAVCTAQHTHTYLMQGRP